MSSTAITPGKEEDEDPSPLLPPPPFVPWNTGRKPTDSGGSEKDAFEECRNMQFFPFLWQIKSCVCLLPVRIAKWPFGGL